MGKDIVRIGFWFKVIRWDDNGVPDFFSGYYGRACRQLFERIIAKKAKIYVVREAGESYLGDGVFSDLWEVCDSNGELKFCKIDGEIKLDLLFRRSVGSAFDFENMKQINPTKVVDICKNKYSTYLFAPDFHAKTMLVSSDDDLRLVRLGSCGKEIALKELEGYAGKKVFVGRLEEYAGGLCYPLIAQEFIDTRGGAPGLTDGPHDLRVALINGKVMHGLLRQPPSGSLKSSTVSDGGSSKALFVDEIPKDVIGIAEELDKRLDMEGPRLFCADFGYNGKEWKLFEMNSSPSLAHRSVDGPAADEYLEILADGLIDSASV